MKQKEKGGKRSLSRELSQLERPSGPTFPISFTIERSF